MATPARSVSHRHSALVAAAAGSTSGWVIDGVFYGLDSYKIHQHYCTNRLNLIKPFSASGFAALHRGFLPVNCTGSALGFGVFFLLYESTKSALNSVGGSVIPSTAIHVSASCLAAVPASLVTVPSDLLKKRVVLNLSPNVRHAVRTATREAGVRGLFIGWQANALRDVPFAAIKMTLYEEMCELYKGWVHPPSPHTYELGVMESGGLGFASGVATAVLTNPLDVANTYLKTRSAAVAEQEPMGVARAVQAVLRERGPLALFRGLPIRTFIISLGGSAFWSMQATLRGFFSSTPPNA